MKQFRSVRVSALAMLAALLVHTQAKANLIISIQEVGPDVVATGSGTINLAELVFNSRRTVLPTISPSGRLFMVGSSGSIDFYGGTSGPSSFGSGGLTFASSSSGDTLGNSIGFVAVPTGYTSGALLEGSATFSGQSFATLGLNPGTYVFTWGSGPTADSMSVQVGVPVPVPSSFSLSLVGTAALALGGGIGPRRRSRAAR